MAALAAAFLWPRLAGTAQPLMMSFAVLLSAVALAHRMLRDRWLFRMAAAGAGIKLLAAMLLFYISAWNLPFLQQFHLGGGFWTFAPDSLVYDRFGRDVALAWQFGRAFPTGWETVEAFSLYTGAVYYVFGSHPLIAIALNAWHATVAVIAGVVIAQRFGASTWTTRGVAAALAFWPSLILWSALLLKDTFVLSLLMVALWVCVELCAPTVRRGTAWLWWLALALLPFPLWFLRFYLDYVLALGLLTGIAAGAVVWGRTDRTQRLQAMRCLAAFAIFAAALVVADRTDYIALLQPAVRGEPVAANSLAPQARRSPGAAREGSRSLGSVVAALGDMPEVLGAMRQGVASEGGTVIDESVRIRSVRDLVVYLPRGLVVLYFSPFPWQWFTPGQSTGALRLMAVVETVLLYLLCPLLLGALLQVLRAHDARLWLLAGTTTAVACALAIAVPNMGTLFRLRLLAIFPMIALLAATEPGWRQLWFRQSQPPLDHAKS